MPEDAGSAEASAVPMIFLPSGITSQTLGSVTGFLLRSPESGIIVGSPNEKVGPVAMPTKAICPAAGL